MPLTAPPAAPSTSSPETFAADADAFLAWLITFRNELNTIIGATIPAGSAAAGTLTGATLASNVTASSLTSVGTLTSLAVSGAADLTGLVRTGGETSGAENLRVLQTTSDFTAKLRNSNASPQGLWINYSASDPNATGNTFLTFTAGATIRGEWRSNGGRAAFTANDVNLCDARVKPIVESLRANGLIPAFYEAHKRIDWTRFKYVDQTHEDWNYGNVAQNIRDTFKDIAPELVDLWESDRMVPVTRKVARQVPEVIERNGRYVLTAREIEVDEPVVDEFPLVDEAGDPVMVMVSAPVIIAGKELKPAVYEPAVHRVPKMELRPASDLLAIYGEDLKNITGMIVTELQHRHDALVGALLEKGIVSESDLEAAPAE